MIYKLLPLIFIVIFAVYISKHITKENYNIITFKCNEKESNHINMQYSFLEIVNEIDSKVVDLTNPEDLFMIDNFNKIYNNPCQFKNDALNFLEINNNTYQKKLIVLFSMQKLCIDEYIHLIEIIYDLFLNNNLKNSHYAFIIDPGFNGYYPIISNYKQPEIRRLLNKFLNSDNINESEKVYVKDILSGKVWKNIKKFKKDSGHWD